MPLWDTVPLRDTVPIWVTMPLRDTVPIWVTMPLWDTVPLRDTVLPRQWDTIPVGYRAPMGYRAVWDTLPL